jgi:hypothetical protein
MTDNFHSHTHTFLKFYEVGILWFRSIAAKFAITKGINTWMHCNEKLFIGNFLHNSLTHILLQSSSVKSH